MRSAETQTVYKYFDLADRFVRVRVLDPERAGLQVEGGMNRSAYRRSVIRACIEEFDGLDLNRVLEDLHPCDPIAAEDHLYQLCISVNPGLEIHTVSLAEEPEARARTKRSRGKKSPREDLTARLRRTAAVLLQARQRRAMS